MNLLARSCRAQAASVHESVGSFAGNGYGTDCCWLDLTSDPPQQRSGQKTDQVVVRVLLLDW
jgi:hypothetical protein